MNKSITLDKPTQESVSKDAIEVTQLSEKVDSTSEEYSSSENQNESSMLHLK